MLLVNGDPAFVLMLCVVQGSGISLEVAVLLFLPFKSPPVLMILPYLAVAFVAYEKVGSDRNHYQKHYCNN